MISSCKKWDLHTSDENHALTVLLFSIDVSHWGFQFGVSLHFPHSEWHPPPLHCDVEAEVRIGLGAAGVGLDMVPGDIPIDLEIGKEKGIKQHPICDMPDRK